jgi:hypothetical protein
MAGITTSLIVGGLGLASGAMSASSQSRAAGRAVDAQTQASEAQIALQREQYNDTRNLSRPVAEAGNSARARQMLMQGFSPEEVRAFLSSSQNAWAGGPTATTGTTSEGALRQQFPTEYAAWSGMRNDGIDGNFAQAGSFQDYLGAQPNQGQPQTPGVDNSWVDNWSYESSSPSYAFRMGQGTQALERSAAARGRLFSGATGRALTEYGQNFASQEFENDFRRLGSLSGAGDSAQGVTINAGQNYANQAGNAMQNAGNARASGYLAQGQASSNFWGNTVPGALGLVGGFGGWGSWGGSPGSTGPGGR